MKNTISLKTYCSIDIAIFSLISFVFEIICAKCIGIFNEIYCVSLFLPITLISMVRWKQWGIVVVVISTIGFCFANGSTNDVNIIYLLGNSCIIVDILWVYFKKKEVQNNFIYTVLYIISGYLLICLGRALFSVFYGYNFISAAIGYLGVELINLALAILIIWISKRQNGLFEDQIDYLRRVKEEEGNNEVKS